MPRDPLGLVAHPGLNQTGPRRRAARGSAPPPARPRGPLFPFPGPAAFPQGRPCLRSTPGLLSPARSREPGSGIPLARKQPQSRCWMGAFGAGWGHSALGYPALLPVPARCRCPSQPPGCSRLPGFAMCPSHHPGILSIWELGMLLLPAQGVLGWRNHHTCAVRDPAAKQGGCAGLCPPSTPLCGIGALTLAEVNMELGPR